MNELSKINRVIDREYPGVYRENLIVLDATTGQNAIQQLKEFNDVTDITGIILTKMDGTAKGGIVVAIQAEFGIPVKYIGVGEKIEDLILTASLRLSLMIQKLIMMMKKHHLLD